MAAYVPTIPPNSEELGKNYLEGLRWPSGLMTQMTANWREFPYRFMVLDDSGSMSINDGEILMEHGSIRKAIKTSRWKEMGHAAKFHAELANIAKAPTEFCFLNNGAPIVVGEEEDDGENMGKVKKILDGSPSGGTPLVRVLNEVHAKIKRMEPTLRQRNQKVSLTIFTDGVASDGNLEAVLRKFHHLPVWVVIRLCTNEDNVVDYWNGIDDDLELEMDVLDDLIGEAKEVTRFNPWITYGEPLHRLRESGCRVKAFDHLDERRLIATEIHSCMPIIIGGKIDEYVHPDLDFAAYVSSVSAAVQRAPDVWDPLARRMNPWIKTNRLKGGGCCSIS